MFLCMAGLLLDIFVTLFLPGHPHARSNAHVVSRNRKRFGRVRNPRNRKAAAGHNRRRSLEADPHEVHCLQQAAWYFSSHSSFWLAPQLQGKLLRCALRLVWDMLWIT